METIEHGDRKLIISIPTNDPAALHAQLMHSIAANIRYSTSATEKTKTYETDVLPLLNLLMAIMPGERELSRAFTL